VRYRLLRPAKVRGVFLAAGTVLDTDQPPRSMFYVAYKDADDLQDEGIVLPMLDDDPSDEGKEDPHGTAWRAV